MVDSRSAIIVGVGPFISSSLAHRLAAQGWKIALLSRSQDKLDALTKALKDKHPDVTVVTHAVDAGDVNAFLHALSETKAELSSVDVLCYNAARVGELFEEVHDCSRIERIGNLGMDDLMTVKPETVEADFKTAAIGTLIAGRWFAKNANTSRVKQGEYPLLLVTGGVLPQVSWASTYRNGARQLTLTASFPFFGFTFGRQICFSKHCHQLFY